MFQVFSNATVLVGWTEVPQHRGTSSILFTCLSTTFLCIWTALHLNIPCANQTEVSWLKGRRFWRKIVWLFLGLVAPDLVVYTAWHQNKEARKLYHSAISLVDNHASSCNSNRSSGPKVEWTMTHSFYAVMGGFVLDAHGPDGFLPLGRTSITLTPGGVEYLMRYHPNILRPPRKPEIDDRSKANALAKAIVCAQAGWFIVQCLSRLAVSSPISLLEVRIGPVL